LDQFEDRRYAIRLLLLSAAGAVGAMLLTWFMYELIHSSRQRLDETERAHLVDFVRLQREEASLPKRRRLERPVSTEAPPAPVAAQTDTQQTDSVLAVSETLDISGLGTDIKIGGLGFDSSDGEYLPIVKIAPVYPQRALFMSIEGQCVVEYTVTTAGTTRDVKVLEDLCTDRIFYKSSIEAAKKFKYKPRIIDGEAVEVHRVRNRFIYELADLNHEK
jgi:protein TonB